jgi:hypothetical protein
MTTYLVKRTAEETLHFRVTQDKEILNVIEGQFYNWLSEWGKNLGTTEKASKEAEMLINAKRAEGYIEEPFIATKENTFNVYDKAKYHYNGDFPEELDEFQGYVHTGMYVGWLIEYDLLNKENFEGEEDALQDVKVRRLTGAQFYEQHMDGVMLLEDLSEAANRFSMWYFDFDDGKYLEDYAQTLATDLPSIYHVEDNWDNYTKLSYVIGSRFEEWYEQC